MPDQLIPKPAARAPRRLLKPGSTDVVTDLQWLNGVIGADVALLDSVSERYGVYNADDFRCVHMRKLAQAIGWVPCDPPVRIAMMWASTGQREALDAELPYGLLRYLSAALELRRAPILIREFGITSTLVSHGKQCRRSWREIVGTLEHKGYGKMSQVKLAQWIGRLA